MAEEVKDEGTRQAILDLAMSIKESSERTISTLSNLSQSETATEKITQAEADRETEQRDAEKTTIFREIRDALTGSFATFKDRDQKSGGILAGLLGGIGTGIGALGKGVAKLGVGFAKGLAALGAGIAGFMLALGAADVILSLMGADGKTLQTVIGNFFGAFTEETAGMMGGIILAAGLLAGFKVKATDFAKAMTGIGAGIAGFMAGILIGDAGAQLALMGGLDGGSIAKIITNFFGSFDETSAAGLGVVLTIAGLLAGFKVDAKQFALQMTGVGAGIAGFAGGLLIGDAGAKLAAMAGLDGGSITTLVNNFFGGMTAEAQAGLGIVVTIAGLLTAFKVDPKQFALQMSGVGAGIAGFAGGLLIGDAGAKLAAMAGLDGGSITTLVNNFFGGMTAEAQAGLGIVVTIAGLLTAFKVDAKTFAKQMTGVGAGIAGFAGGLLVGDAGAKLGAMAGLDGSSITTLMSNFFGAIDEKIALGFAVVVTAAGAMGKFNVEPMEFVKSMTAVGAGISGFMAGILLGEGAAGLASLAGLDGSNISALMTNFFGGMTAEVAGGLGVVTTAGALIAKFNVPAAQMVLGMSAIGAGIAGFSLGILLADGAAKLGAMAGLDGKSLKTLMGNFLGVFDGIGTGTLIALFAAVAGAALAPPAVILGFTALGAGIAAFMGFMVAADFVASFGSGENLKVLLTNIGGAIGGFIGAIGGEMMKQLEDLDADKLGKLGEGIKNIGMGMLAFAGGQVAGAAGSLVSSISSLFGGDSPIDMITDLSKDKDIDAERLKVLGDGIAGLGLGMKAFGEIDAEAIKNNITQINALGQVETSTFDNVSALASQAAGLAKSAGTSVAEGTKSMVESVKESSVGNTLSKLKEKASNELFGEEKGPRAPVEGEVVRALPEGEFTGEDNAVGTVTKEGGGEKFYYGEENRRILAQGMVPHEFQSLKEGGFVTGTGLAMLHGTPSQPEFVLDNQAAAVFLKAATLLSGSQVMAQNGMGSGSPVIINNVDNSQRNPVVSNQATQIKVPDNPRPSDPTMLAVQGSQMFN